MFRTVNQILFYFSGCFYYLSSTLNPLLYNVMSVKYRQVTIEHYSAQSCHNESSSNPFYQIMDNLVRLSAPLSRALRTLMTVRQCWSSPRCSTPRPPTCWPRATSTWRTCWTAGATAGPVWAWGLTPASWALATPPDQGRSGAAASVTPPTCCSSPSWDIRGFSMVRSPGGNASLETRYVDILPVIFSSEQTFLGRRVSVTAEERWFVQGMSLVQWNACVRRVSQ